MFLSYLIHAKFQTSVISQQNSQANMELILIPLIMSSFPMACSSEKVNTSIFLQLYQLQVLLIVSTLSIYYHMFITIINYKILAYVLHCWIYASILVWYRWSQPVQNCLLKNFWMWGHHWINFSLEVPVLKNWKCSGSFFSCLRFLL